MYNPFFMTERRRPAIIRLWRHGQTEFHGTNRVAGGLVNVPLDATGRQQAKDLAEKTRYHRVTGVDASPLSRAVDTVSPLAVIHGIRPVREVPELRERPFGRAIEFLTDERKLAEIREDLGAWWRSDPAERLKKGLVHGMESDGPLLSRIRRYLRRVPAGEEIEAGTHWDVISTLTLHETGKLISPDNGGGITVEVAGGEITVVDMHSYKEMLPQAA
jgi:broad specificity phosphatase PhoE